MALIEQAVGTARHTSSVSVPAAGAQLVAQALVLGFGQFAVEELEHLSGPCAARLSLEHVLELLARFVDAPVHDGEEPDAHAGVLRRGVHRVELSQRLFGLLERRVSMRHADSRVYGNSSCGRSAIAARYSGTASAQRPFCRKASASRIRGIQ